MDTPGTDVIGAVEPTGTELVRLEAVAVYVLHGLGGPTQGAEVDADVIGVMGGAFGADMTLSPEASALLTLSMLLAKTLDARAGAVPGTFLRELLAQLAIINEALGK